MCTGGGDSQALRRLCCSWRPTSDLLRWPRSSTTNLRRRHHTTERCRDCWDGPCWTRSSSHPSRLHGRLCTTCRPILHSVSSPAFHSDDSLRLSSRTGQYSAMPEWLSAFRNRQLGYVFPPDGAPTEQSEADYREMGSENCDCASCRG